MNKAKLKLQFIQTEQQDKDKEQAVEVIEIVNSFYAKCFSNTYLSIVIEQLKEDKHTDNQKDQFYLPHLHLLDNKPCQNVNSMYFFIQKPLQF